MTVKKTGGKPKLDLKDEIRRLMNPEAAKELNGLSPTFQQFLIRWIDLRDFAIMDEMKEFVQKLYEKDNEQMCKNIAEIVVAQNRKIFDTLEEQTGLLKKIEENIIDIKSDIVDIKRDIVDIKRRLDNHEKRIKVLESKL
jgi:septal ring factor EnvC (AmiA/AmiB activator)